jgi:hypothetical protein
VFELELGVAQTLTAPAGSIAAGVPQHVVATFDGSMRRLYVDGVEVAAAPLAGATANPGPLFVGSTGGLSGFFDGTIDELAIYSQALTSARVTAHYAEGAGIVDPDPDPPTDPSPPSGPPKIDPPPAVPPPAVPPPAKAPLAKSCQRAIGSRTLARRRLDAARKRVRAARRPVVKRRRQKVVAQRRMALRLARAHVTRVCASAR